jgi:hypothetical protein
VREGRGEVHDFHGLDARTRDISLLPLHFLRLIEGGETVEVKHDYSLLSLSFSHLELLSMVHIYFTMQTPKLLLMAILFATFIEFILPDAA